MATQSQIRQLQTPDHSVDVYPLTVEDAVFDEDGVKLSEKLEEMVIGVPLESAETPEYPYLTSGDIIDTLASTATNRPLSANQGNRLKKAVVQQNKYDLTAYADEGCATEGLSLAANATGYVYLDKNDIPSYTWVLIYNVVSIMDSGNIWLPIFSPGYSTTDSYIKIKVHNLTSTAQQISKVKLRVVWENINPNNL